MDPSSAHAAALAALVSQHPELQPAAALIHHPTAITNPSMVDPMSPAARRALPSDALDPFYPQQQHVASYFPQTGSTYHMDPTIKTIFIAGLPDDVKPREIHNLFRRRYGFESSQLKYTGRGNQVVAFATFFDHQSAVAAMESLNGTKFDPITGATLHIELARSNSRIKCQRGSSAYMVIDNRVKESKGAEENWSNDGDGGSDDPSSMTNTSSSNKSGLPSAQSGEAIGDLASFQENNPSALTEKPVSGENAPCSTLFIANLGPHCTEKELSDVLSKFPGFQMLKLQAKGGMPVAFADFQDVACSTEALKSLQGCLLPSSDRGGMHLEYARSKMRKTR